VAEAAARKRRNALGQPSGGAGAASRGRDTHCIPLSPVRLHLPLSRCPVTTSTSSGNEYHAAQRRADIPAGTASALTRTGSTCRSAIRDHGRSGTLVPSHPFTLPCGSPGGGRFRPGVRAVPAARLRRPGRLRVGVGSTGPVPLADFADHVFGVFPAPRLGPPATCMPGSLAARPVPRKSFANLVSSPWGCRRRSGRQG